MNDLELGWEIVGSVLIIVVVVVIFSELVTVGLAPQPGDVFYPVWSAVPSIGFEALLLSATGVAAVGLYLIDQPEF